MIVFGNPFHFQWQVYVGSKKVGTLRWRKGVDVYMFPCNGAAGSFVKVVHKSNWLHMAEIQVFGGAKPVKNLGLLSQGRPTKQNSIGWGGHPKRAVDGNVGGYYGAKTSTHSKGKKNNWWQVDLGKTYPVYLVLIHNRIDKCCRNRIDGAKVYLDKQLCGTISWAPNVNVYPVDCAGKKRITPFI